jgi:hypothetical protein
MVKNYHLDRQLLEHQPLARMQETNQIDLYKLIFERLEELSRRYVDLLTPSIFYLLYSSNHPLTPSPLHPLTRWVCER